jgi:hypothetical protein
MSPSTQELLSRCGAICPEFLLVSETEAVQRRRLLEKQSIATMVGSAPVPLPSICLLIASLPFTAAQLRSCSCLGQHQLWYVTMA